MLLYIGSIFHQNNPWAPVHFQKVRLIRIQNWEIQLFIYNVDKSPKISNRFFLQIIKERDDLERRFNKILNEEGHIVL